ncbi:DMT family transporter [Roseibacillus persicicus]|uniref:DMT family transporter n=1 Tax=Roseibacillus persicicus TaxID=454148 RepID=UPI00280E697C|nr:DMT family transporter [Roseibacillus persicicus]MDQ8191405.1 DMT family transporter [Roseibacillus persicicus]
MKPYRGQNPSPSPALMQSACQILPRFLQLNLLVLLWSLTGILGEYLSLEPAALVFWRTAIASGMFYFFCRLKEPHLLRISRKNLFTALIAGFLLGVHWLCFFGAIAVSNVSIGLAGFASTALFTALLEPLIEKRRPNPSHLTLAAVVVLGIALIGGAKTSVPNSMLGLSIALVGAALAAAYSILSKNLVVAAVPGPTMMAYQIPAACLTSLLAILVVPAFEFQLPQSTDWIPLLILALACTFGAYLWFARLLKHLSAYTINLAINFEPVYGFLMAAALFHEHQALTPTFYLGAVVIVIANVLHSRQPQ